MNKLDVLAFHTKTSKIHLRCLQELKSRIGQRDGALILKQELVTGSVKRWGGREVGGFAR